MFGMDSMSGAVEPLKDVPEFANLFVMFTNPILGMIVGAAVSHNFGLAGNPDSTNELGEYVVGGISTQGKIAVIICIAVVLVIFTTIRAEFSR